MEKYQFTEIFSNQLPRTDGEVRGYYLMRSSVNTQRIKNVLYSIKKMLKLVLLKLILKQKPQLSFLMITTKNKHQNHNQRKELKND